VSQERSLRTESSEAFDAEPLKLAEFFCQGADRPQGFRDLPGDAGISPTQFGNRVVEQDGLTVALQGCPLNVT